MKTLYLLRHAHTLDAAPPRMGDHERMLSPQGAEEARAVGLFMKKNKLHPDFILSSSATRTMQTTELLMETLGGKIPSRFDRGLYHASADRILSDVRQQDASVQSLLMVTHNPGAAELAMRLGGIEYYAPATLSVFKADCQDWADFFPEVVGLEMVFAPKI